MHKEDFLAQKMLQHLLKLRCVRFFQSMNGQLIASDEGVVGITHHVPSIQKAGKRFVIGCQFQLVHQKGESRFIPTVGSMPRLGRRDQTGAGPTVGIGSGNTPISGPWGQAKSRHNDIATLLLWVE